MVNVLQSRPPVQNSMKVRPVGATLFPEDMDAHNEAVYFRNSSANAPKETNISEHYWQTSKTATAQPKMYFWHTMKRYSHSAEFPNYEATNMLEKVSQLRLVLRIHHTNPLSYNEICWQASVTFQYCTVVPTTFQHRWTSISMVPAMATPHRRWKLAKFR